MTGEGPEIRSKEECEEVYALEEGAVSLRECVYGDCDWFWEVREGELDFRKRDGRSTTPAVAVAENVGSRDAAELSGRGGFLVSFREVCLEEVGVIEFEEEGSGLRSSI